MFITFDRKKNAVIVYEQFPKTEFKNTFARAQHITSYY